MSNPDIPPHNLPARPALRRLAMALVITMSVLLALAFVAVVWGFIRQGRILLDARAPAAAATPTDAMVLPPGTHILSSSTDAGRLVLRLATPQGEEIRIIDLSTGKLVQTIKAAK